MLTDCNGPKVGIKLLKISHVRILFLVSLLLIAVINPVLNYLIFKNSSCLLFYSILIQVHINHGYFLGA